MTDLLTQIAGIVGQQGLLTGADVSGRAADFMGLSTCQAKAIVRPASTAELSAVMKLCHAAGQVVVPAGGNTGLVHGNVCQPDDIQISLERMRGIGAIDPVGRTMIVEAGCPVQAAQEAAAAQGLKFAVDWGARGSATIGGGIATNAGGNSVVRYGMMRDNVLGLEAVLADGTVISSLNVLLKNNAAYDLKQLFIGSEGTLGIITAATLRLVPAAAARQVIWAGLGSVQQARALLLHCQNAAGDLLEGFEVLPQSCLAAVLAYLPDARAPLAGQHAWHALIELAGDDPAPLGEAMLGAALEQGLLDDAAIAASETQAEAFWTLRDSISPAERAKGPAMQHDIAVPVDRMADFITAAVPAIEQRWPGVYAFGFGHLGDGNVHFHVLAPPGAPRGSWEAGDGKAISRMVHDLVSQWHGTISAEHGIGQMKLAELERLGDPVQLALMRSVKAALDPVGLFNPGKLLALAPTPPNA